MGNRVSIDDRQLRVLITGAGRGIGRAIVSALKGSPLEHRIAVTARTESELRESIEGAIGETFIITGDLLDSRAPAMIVEEVVRRFGGIDLLVLNAGDGVAATIEAIAATGSKNMANGTSSAVAIVAVKPGINPTTKPNTDETKIVSSTSG